VASVIAEVDNYDVNITVPDPGDSRSAASVRVAFQSLANRCRNLRHGTTEEWTCDNNVIVNGQLYPQGGIICDDAAQFNAYFECAGQTMNLAGSTITGNVTFADHVAVGSDGIECVGGDITATGGTVKGTAAQFGATSAGALTAGSGSFYDRISFVLNGRVTHRGAVPTFSGGSPAASVNFNQVRYVFIPAASFAADATLTITGTPQEGEELFVTSDETNFCEIRYLGALVATVGSVPAGLPRTVQLVWISGSWRVMQAIPYL
jgi:hypothetical protein